MASSSSGAAPGQVAPSTYVPVLSPEPADEEMAGQEAPSSQPQSSVGRSSRDANAACRKLVAFLQAAWAEVPSEGDRDFMVNEEVEALEEGVRRFQLLSEYADLWLETEVSELEWLKEHRCEIQNALTYLADLEPKGRNWPGSDASPPAGTAFSVWNVNPSRKKAWLSCLEEWMSGVEADMIRQRIVPVHPSLVQGTIIEVERAFIGDYVAHANFELATARSCIESSLMVLQRGCFLAGKISSLTRDSRSCTVSERRTLSLGGPGALMPVDKLISMACIRNELTWSP